MSGGQSTRKWLLAQLAAAAATRQDLSSCMCTLQTPTLITNQKLGQPDLVCCVYGFYNYLAYI